jgi:hypothetical protein
MTSFTFSVSSRSSRLQHGRFVEGEETGEAWARRLLAEGLRREGWAAADLAQRRKGDAGKVRMARRLRSETTMTLNWIAKELNMGTAGSLANLLRKKK